MIVVIVMGNVLCPAELAWLELDAAFIILEIILGIPLVYWCEHEINLIWLRPEFALGIQVQVPQE